MAGEPAKSEPRNILRGSSRDEHSMKCYLCNSDEYLPIKGKVRDKPDLKISKCAGCGLVFLDNHDHITEEYYASIYSKENHAEQNLEDFQHETNEDDERRFDRIRSLIRGKKYLDIGCGGGGVIQRARGLCSLAVGVEPQDKWRQALAEREVTVYPDLAQVPITDFDVVTMFHVLEHIPDPRPFLSSLKSKIRPGGRLIIEVPNADDALLKLYDCLAFSHFTYWSAHLYLFNRQTLGTLLSQAGYEGWHIEQFQRYPLANHLRWLAKGEPGGHETWSFLKSPELDSAYAAKLAGLDLCDTLIAHITVE